MKPWLLSIALLAIHLSSAGAADMAAGPPKGHPRGVHFLYLIRHGIYDPDTTVSDDRVGNGLNALGHEQAKLTGACLAQLPIKLHSLVSSDFTRALQTADDSGAAIGMAPTRDSLLEECTPPADRADFMSNHSTADMARCDARLQAAWTRYFTATPDADQHDVLVCHGNVIRWMVAKALGLDSTRWTHMDIANCSLTIIGIRSDGSARLVMFSDVGHIPAAKQTWSGVGAGWGKK